MGVSFEEILHRKVNTVVSWTISFSTRTRRHSLLQCKDSILNSRYNHTLNIATSPINITVRYEPIAINNSQVLDFAMSPINHASCNLLINGPISICVNAECQQPIFTEAWVTVGASHHTEPVTTVALCCCKRYDKCYLYISI